MAKKFFKIALGLSFVVVVALLAIGSPKKDAQSTPPAEVKQEEKAPEIDYRTLSNRYLEAAYTDMAAKAGTGVPDIDTFITHYEEYHKDGIVITKNSYYLAGNENITHKFTMEFKEGDTQLIFLMIDGKVLLSNR